MYSAEYSAYQSCVESLHPAVKRIGQTTRILSSHEFFSRNRMQTDLHDSQTDYIDQLLDSIVVSSSHESCSKDIVSHKSPIMKLPLSLVLAERVISSVYSSRSFPSTTPRGVSARCDPSEHSNLSILHTTVIVIQSPEIVDRAKSNKSYVFSCANIR